MRKNVLAIAMAAYAVVGAYSAAIGDTPMPPWEQTSQAVRDGTVKGVEMVLADPTLTLEDQHNAWAAARFADGWVYGKIKDPEAKTHPNLVPYAELPTEQKVKDVLFRAVVEQCAQFADVPDLTSVTPLTLAQAPDPTPGAYKAIRYYHPTRPDFEDHAYGTGLKFTENQVRSLPAVIADKFLKHVDLFTEVDATSAPEPATVAAIEESQVKREHLDQKQVEIEALRDQINTLPTKQAMVDFAKARFQQDLSAKAKATKVEDLRQQVLGLVDLYGPAAA